MVNEEYDETIRHKQDELKQAILKHIQEMPIITVACKKAGVGHATFYRWKNEDQKFAGAIGLALKDGVRFVNDMSESQVIQLIKEKSMPAITLWLKHNNPRYGGKEIPDNSPLTSPLTKDEERLFRKALSLSSGINIKKTDVERHKAKRSTKYITE